MLAFAVSCSRSASNSPPTDLNCESGWCRVASGTFTKGSPETEWGRGLYSEDQVTVTLTHSFMIQQHETTQAEWTALGYHNPSGLLTNGTGDCTDDPRCPVGNVNWFEALAYANRLSEVKDPPLPACYALSSCTGDVGYGMKCGSVTLNAPTVYDCTGFRLPTDAEWEYAIRAGSQTAFYAGDITKGTVLSACTLDANLDKIAWYCFNSGGFTHPVGQKMANAWGLYDMSGNVEEWTNDRHTGTSPSAPVTDPGSSLEGSSTALRLTRGGLFNAWPTVCRSASHLGGPPSPSGPGLGFRLVRTL
jgi:formylglycine-generating enzyme